MSERRNVPGIRRYEHSAGGWGALRATAKAVREQMDVAEAPGLLSSHQQARRVRLPRLRLAGQGAHLDLPVLRERRQGGHVGGHQEARAAGILCRPYGVVAARMERLRTGERGPPHPPAWPTTAPATPTSRSAGMRPSPASARCCAACRTPNMAEFYTSGRASNEAAFLFQLFAREYGTNNFPDCSNMCHEATSVGLPKSIGIGKGTVSLDDFDHCELIIAMGHNPGTNHPRMMGTLHECCPARRADHRLQPAAGTRAGALRRSAESHGDGDLRLDAHRLVLLSGQGRRRRGGAEGHHEGAASRWTIAAGRRGVLDHEFIAEHTNGFEAFAADLVRPPGRTSKRPAVCRERDLRRVADAYAKSNATIVSYGMGITQHSQGTANVQQIANLLLLRGNFGKPGAGICPLRGHSNVQGDRTVGITEKPDRRHAGRHRARVRLQAAAGAWP